MYRIENGILGKIEERLEEEKKIIAENRMKEKQPHPHLNFKLNCMYITDMVCTRI